MSTRTALIALAMLSLAPFQMGAAALHPPGDDPQVINVRMVDEGGGQWRFEPASVDARPGDIVRFTQGDVVPHNVQFKSGPQDADLGDAAMGPFLTHKGETYDVVINQRFPPGTYHFVCTPHEMLGMKGTLTVRGADDPESASPSGAAPAAGGLR
ncbi:MAG TPA: plastocyanin/azurin family copper-binding protein [Longimicrobiales bacterium]|nr:plastocyanin/azurin family copper-binding protein [Longimicrobiales bacterium]